MPAWPRDTHNRDSTRTAAVARTRASALVARLEAYVSVHPPRPANRLEQCTRAARQPTSVGPTPARARRSRDRALSARARARDCATELHWERRAARGGRRCSRAGCHDSVDSRAPTLSLMTCAVRRIRVLHGLGYRACEVQARRAAPAKITAAS